MDEDEWRRACSATELLVNLSGGRWFWRDEYAATAAMLAEPWPGRPFSALWHSSRRLETAEVGGPG
jgi:hypothetical protein